MLILPMKLLRNAELPGGEPQDCVSFIPIFLRSMSCALQTDPRAMRFDQWHSELVDANRVNVLL